MDIFVTTALSKVQAGKPLNEPEIRVVMKYIQALEQIAREHRKFLEKSGLEIPYDNFND